MDKILSFFFVISIFNNHSISYQLGSMRYDEVRVPGEEGARAACTSGHLSSGRRSETGHPYSPLKRVQQKRTEEGVSGSHPAHASRIRTQALLPATVTHTTGHTAKHRDACFLGPQFTHL